MEAWGFSLRFEKIAKIDPYGLGTETTSVLLADTGIGCCKISVVGISMLFSLCWLFLLSVFQHRTVFTPEEVHLHDQIIYSML